MPLNDIGNNESFAINDTDGNPVSVSGSIFVNLISSSLDLIGTQNNPSINSFQEYSLTPYKEHRISQPFAYLDFVNTYEINDIDLETSITGSQTSVFHQPQVSGIRLATSGTAPTAALMKTITSFPYQAGKSMVHRNVVYVSGDSENQIKRWGVFDQENGLFFEQIGTQVSLVRRTSTSGTPVDIKTNQASWNIDPMDGTGPSEQVLNLNYSNMYEIHWQWYGTGTVRWFINATHIHTDSLFNVESAPYMGTSTLPINWEVRNTSGSPAGTLTVIGSSLFAENGNKPPELNFSIVNSAFRSVASGETAILAIRPKNTFGSRENKSIILPKRAAIATDGRGIRYRLYTRPTSLTGGTAWESVNERSTVEWSEGFTSFITGSQTQLVFAGVLAASQESVIVDISEFFSFLNRKIRKRTFSGEQEILFLTVQNLKGGSTDVESAFEWGEIK